MIAIIRAGAPVGSFNMAGSECPGFPRRKVHSHNSIMLRQRRRARVLPMLGYTAKDAGKEHHKHHSKNTPVETLRAAAATYDTMSTSYFPGLPEAEDMCIDPVSDGP
jgi:hypothetical protein